MHIAALNESPGAIATDLPADFTDLSPADASSIRQAYSDYALVVFRGRELSVAEQIAICATLGIIIDQAATGQCWFNITNKGGGYDGPLCFHADFTNTHDFLTGASLYASALPNGATATLFAHTGTALDALPPALRSQIGDMHAVHSAMTPRSVADTPVRHQAGHAADPRAEHPSCSNTRAAASRCCS